MSISSPPNYGTPDWQRGVTSAQKLLATVPAGTVNVIVEIPQSLETLIILAPGGNPGDTASVIGQTTFTYYPGKNVHWTSSVGNGSEFWFNVSPALDDHVEVIWQSTGGGQWYVYADMGVRLTSDLGVNANGYGEQYVIPTPPSTVSGDHPPSELAVAYGNSATPYNIIAAPAAGRRLRLFALAMEDNGTDAASYIVNQSTGVIYLPCAAPGNNSLTIPLTGLPLPSSQGVNVVSSTSGRLVAATVYYTIEYV